MSLTEPAKTKDSIDFRRRNFLIRCCQGASTALIPARLRGLAFPSIFDSPNKPTLKGDVDFHLHPHYRAQMPLDATLLKTQAGLDKFRHGEISGSDRENSRRMEFEPAAISEGHAGARKGSYS